MKHLLSNFAFDPHPQPLSQRERGEKTQKLLSSLSAFRKGVRSEGLLWRGEVKYTENFNEYILQPVVVRNHIYFGELGNAHINFLLKQSNLFFTILHCIMKRIFLTLSIITPLKNEKSCLYNRYTS